MLLMEERPLSGRVKELGVIRIINVSGSEDENLWDEMVRKYHYLGLGKIIGPRIKYLALHNGKAIAAIGFNRASKAIGVRENYIGWDAQQRMALLKNVVNNMRYLILPWVRVKNLASCLLSRTVKILCADWEARYGEKPQVLETFVDGSQYKGTCYLAAGWKYLGETRGFSKVGKTFEYHGHKKKVFVRIIDKRFVERLKKGKNESAYSRPAPKIKNRGEYAMMLETMTDWSPTLLGEAGVTEGGVSSLGEKLMSYIENFFKCFSRSEGRANFLLYITGLLSDLERKSIEPIVLRYARPEKVRAMQTFMGAEKAVDDESLKKLYQERLAGDIAEDGGMVSFDGSDIPKKGKKSVGVSRQHCGPLGKVENCQSGVFAGYSSRKGYGLVDFRLYMPESWMVGGGYERRVECHVPEGLAFKTKTELATEMMGGIEKGGVFKYKWVGADSFFGRNKEFLDSIPDGKLYFADILYNMKVYPLGEAAERIGAGTESVKVLDMAAYGSDLWNLTILTEGSKGPITAEEKCFRVREDRGGKPGGEVWLYLRRFSDGKLKCALSNAPADIPMNELRRAATMRWPIEQCFEECKSELGMDQYEGRSWVFWHRHMLFVFIAHLFLLEVRLWFKKNANSDIAAGPQASRCGDDKEHRCYTCCNTAG